jgi:hypothetical protein
MCLVYSPNTSSSLLKIPASDRFVIGGRKKVFPAWMENKGAYPIIMSSLSSARSIWRFTKTVNDSPPCANHRRIVLSREPVATNLPGSTLLFYTDQSDTKNEYKFWHLSHFGEEWICRDRCKHSALNDMLGAA